ncbi:MAG: D-glycerate dehydrogenase [Bdellovibrionales bacterium]|nr:D-glycerate dehydrogenase [Bdellovibrionales bacterium]
MKPSIFVTRRIPQAGLDLLEQHFEITLNEEDRVLEKQEILKGIEGKDALLCLLTDSIDAEVIHANEKLRVISNYAVGYNNIDIAAATSRKLPVCNTPGVLTETTADLTWALLFSTARRVVESDNYLRAGKFHGWGPMLLLGVDIFEKTLGIVGMGRIGSAVAKRAAGFRMKILYTGEENNTEIEKSCNAHRVDMNELLRESDFISLHVPLTNETHHMIGADQFHMMKNSAILINTARGPIVDEKALVEALRNKEIAGAGLDVFEAEPALAPGLAELDNTVLLPHLGSATIETRSKMATLAAKNAIAIFQGERPEAMVNPEVL